MRQWVNAFVVLFVVALMAAFTMSSIVAVVHAAMVLQESVASVDDLVYAESLGECDPFDSTPCF